MFRIYTKTDGLQVVININDLIGIEDVGSYRIIYTIIKEFNITETVSEIFMPESNVNKFSHN